MFQPKAATGKKPQLAIEASPTVVKMEDLGEASGGSKHPVVHQARWSGRRGPDEVEDAKELVDKSEAHLPLSKEGFSDWLVHKKASWRKSRRERKHRGSAEARLRLSLPRSLVPPFAVWKDTFAMQP
jgi:hypothetical protein